MSATFRVWAGSTRAPGTLRAVSYGARSAAPVTINVERSGRVEFDSGHFETEAVGVRRSADRQKDLVDLEPGARMGHRQQIAGFALDSGQLLLGHDGHAAALDPGAQGVAHLAIETPEDLVAAVDDEPSGG